MLKLATQRDARFDVDDRELRREGNTYTYDTLVEVRKERGAEQSEHGARRCRERRAREDVVEIRVGTAGTDAFAKIDTWHRWTELFDLAHFAVAVRANDADWFARGPGTIPREVWPRITLNPKELASTPAGKIMTFAMTPLAISSTALRSLAGEGSSIRYLTPDPVADFIRTHGIYSK